MVRILLPPAESQEQTVPALGWIGAQLPWRASQRVWPIPVRPVVITTFALALPNLKRHVSLCRGAVARSVDHHRPGDTCRLIRQSNGGDVEVAAGQQPGDPCPRHLASTNSMHGRAGTMDQQFPKIGVTSLADAAEPLFAAGRMLFRDQAYPGCKVAT
jgi:hypothetical protein